MTTGSRSPLASINPDQPTVDPNTAPSPSAGPSNSNLPSPPARRRRRQEDLDFAGHDESDAFAQYHPPRPPRNPARTGSANAAVAAPDPLEGQTGTFGQEDDDEELDDEEDDYDRIGSQRPYAPTPTDFQYHSRSYDDEDEALQAALKASMDDLPPGWQPPKIEAKTIKRDSSTRVTPVQSLTSPPPPVLSPVPTAPPPLTRPLPGQPVARDGPVSGSRFKEEVAEGEEPVEQLSAGQSILLIAMGCANEQTRSGREDWPDSDNRHHDKQRLDRMRNSREACMPQMTRWCKYDYQDSGEGWPKDVSPVS